MIKFIKLYWVGLRMAYYEGVLQGLYENLNVISLLSLDESVDFHEMLVKFDQNLEKIEKIQKKLEALDAQLQ